MRRLRFELIGGFEEKDLQEIHAGALRVLERIGVCCAHKGLQERLAGQAGVRIRGDRITFAPELVEQHAAVLRESRRGAKPPEEFTVSGPWTGLWLCDPETNDLRRATTADAIDMIKLCDALDLGPGTAPVMAADVPPAFSTIHLDWLCLTHSRTLGGGLSVRNMREVEFLRDLWAAAGRRVTIVAQFLVSPLHFDEMAIDLLLRCMEDPKVDAAPALAIPMLGATAPLDVMGAAIQASAEALAAYITMSVISDGTMRPFEVRLEPFDLKYGGLVFGSAEYDVLSVLADQLYEFYTGAPSYFGRLRSAAKTVGPQSCAERMASALMHALRGARCFGAVGQMSVDEVFSPVQAIIDFEIVRFIERIIRGMPIGRSETGLGAIQRVGPGGQYLDDELTLARYRDMYWTPELFEHWNVGQWMRAGRPEVRTRAAQTVRRLIQQHDYILPEDARREVDKVYERARRALGG